MGGLLILTWVGLTLSLEAPYCILLELCFWLQQKLTYVEARYKSISEDKDKLKEEYYALKRDTSEMKIALDGAQREKGKLEGELTVVKQQSIDLQQVLW